VTVSKNVIKAVTPAPGFCRDRVTGVQKSLHFLDSGYRRNGANLPFLALCELMNTKVLEDP